MTSGKLKYCNLGGPPFKECGNYTIYFYKIFENETDKCVAKNTISIFKLESCINLYILNLIINRFLNHYGKLK